MGRNISDCPPAPDIKPSERYPGSVARTYNINVITPIFGGGTETGTNDPVTPIRPSSIRGHLRFWWRATRGASFQLVKDLRVREGEIWGTTESPSAVQIWVRITDEGEEESCATVAPGRSFSRFNEGYPSYVLFPFQGNVKEQTAPSKARKKLKFTVFQCYPTSLQMDVEAATWAWVNFGGIGARPRRGCGALQCSDFGPNSANGIEDWLKSAYQRFDLTTERDERSWPTLSGALLTSREVRSPLQAWEDAVNLLREFRQGSVGRNPGPKQNQPRRSRWPEADSLRAITGKGDRRHEKSITLPDPKKVPSFPRAEFGLPIVFHFKDAADSPNNCELYPKGKSRMSSPIILKPLGLKEGNKAVAIVLQLKTSPLQAVEVKKIDGPPDLTSFNIRRPDLAHYTNSPMAKRSDRGSAVEAFTRFVKEKGFKEIVP